MQGSVGRMILVIGGSGSGKSAFAEQTIVARGRDMQRYYLATMRIYGEEGWTKVKRHQKLRAGKGFVTIEQPEDITEALVKMDGAAKKAVLLECMSNLVANEMFAPEGQMSAAAVADKVVAQVLTLCRAAGECVIVTNNVFEDGICYDASTMEYLRALGAVNCRLAEAAETVVEVIAGIPVLRKGGL